MSVAASDSLTDLVEGITTTGSPRLGQPPVVRGQIVEWRRQGLSWNAIVKKVGVSRGVVVSAWQEVFWPDGKSHKTSRRCSVDPRTTDL